MKSAIAHFIQRPFPPACKPPGWKRELSVGWVEPLRNPSLKLFYILNPVNLPNLPTISLFAFARVGPATAPASFSLSLRGAQPRGNLAFYAFYAFNGFNDFNDFNDLHD